MGKPTGFREADRQLPACRPVAERLGDWREIHEPHDLEALRTQAARCMDCGIPFCTQGCPLGNVIPDFNDRVYGDRWEAAWLRLSATNNFPEFTGRVCPAPCEAACVLNINAGAVTIEEIEKQIAERAFCEGWARPRATRPRTGNRIAVVGSGPAGLAAAEQLNRAGHHVSVFERADRPGGLLRYGIPDFKLEKWVVERRVALMEAEGVAFRTGAEVGTDLPWTELHQEYDALLVAIGAMRPRDLDVPGRGLAGVHFAMDYLEQQNRVVAGDTIPAAERIDAAGKRVVILGGGDTGSDCLGTALRQGADAVRQIELMPRPPDQRTADNPWPQWPLTHRTSTSHEEGGERSFAMMTTRLSADDGRLTHLHGTEVRLEPGETGRPKLTPVGDEITLACDLLILAMGFTGPVADTLTSQLGVELDPRGNVAAGSRFRTNVPHVYVAGDAHRGASLVVWAIAEGREAARTIDADLCDGDSALPSRGRSCHFGAR